MRVAVIVSHRGRRIAKISNQNKDLDKLSQKRYEVAATPIN